LGAEENIRTKKEGEADWRTLHSEELHNLFASSNIFRLIS